jgi:hypothetical protein
MPFKIEVLIEKQKNFIPEIYAREKVMMADWNDVSFVS